MPAGSDGQRIQRLKRRKDFLRLSSGRKKFVAPGFILQALPRSPDAPAADPRRDNRAPDADPAGLAPSAPDPLRRLGFTATKKIGNAVARNRARRRLRAASDAVMGPHAADGHDYVLIARRETASRAWPELLQDLERALRHLRVYRP